MADLLFTFMLEENCCRASLLCALRADSLLCRQSVSLLTLEITQLHPYRLSQSREVLHSLVWDGVFSLCRKSYSLAQLYHSSAYKKAFIVLCIDDRKPKGREYAVIDMIQKNLMVGLSS